jgi:hypothetical protein
MHNGLVEWATIDWITTSRALPEILKSSLASKNLDTFDLKKQPAQEEFGAAVRMHTLSRSN